MEYKEDSHKFAGVMTQWCCRVQMYWGADFSEILPAPCRKTSRPTLSLNSRRRGKPSRL